jgi:hypothetical protein
MRFFVRFKKCHEHIESITALRSHKANAHDLVGKIDLRDKTKSVRALTSARASSLARKPYLVSHTTVALTPLWRNRHNRRTVVQTVHAHFPRPIECPAIQAQQSHGSHTERARSPVALHWQRCSPPSPMRRSWTQSRAPALQPFNPSRPPFERHSAHSIPTWRARSAQGDAKSTGTVFRITSPRGVVLSTPGTGFAVSANANSGTAVNFGNIDPTFATRFAPFSAQRLFTPIGSNITDVSFFIPGSTNAAVSTAFGLVFSDVDLDTSTSLEFFDSFNSSMGIFHAFGIAGVDQSFSFLGVRFTGGQAFSRVRITSGTQLVARGNPDNDMVVMDDFIYAEPTLLVQQVVPEPATWALLSLGLTAVGIAARRRGR